MDYKMVIPVLVSFALSVIMGTSRNIGFSI